MSGEPQPRDSCMVSEKEDRVKELGDFLSGFLEDLSGGRKECISAAYADGVYEISYCLNQTNIVKDRGAVKVTTKFLEEDVLTALIDRYSNIQVGYDHKNKVNRILIY
jgi:hypothetical protein